MCCYIIYYDVYLYVLGFSAMVFGSDGLTSLTRGEDQSVEIMEKTRISLFFDILMIENEKFN